MLLPLPAPPGGGRGKGKPAEALAGAAAFGRVSPGARAPGGDRTWPYSFTYAAPSAAGGRALPMMPVTTTRVAI